MFCQNSRGSTLRLGSKENPPCTDRRMSAGGTAFVLVC
jgi:hypothetical protein